MLRLPEDIIVLCIKISLYFLKIQEIFDLFLSFFIGVSVFFWPVSATINQTSGVSLPLLQELGGWKTLSMVMRYAHLWPTNLLTAVKVLETATTIVMLTMNIETVDVAEEGRIAAVI